MLILSVVATLVGFAVPLGAEDAKIIADQVDQMVTQGTTEGTLIPDIFVNNFRLCLLMFIPLVGAAIGLFILFNTGMAFRAILETQVASLAATPTPGLTPIPTLSPTPLPDVSSTMAILVLLSIGIVFLLEYVSYTIGMTESIWLFRRILHAHDKVMLKREVKYLLIFIGLVALLLLIGAVVETYGITFGAGV